MSDFPARAAPCAHRARLMIAACAASRPAVKGGGPRPPDLAPSVREPAGPDGVESGSGTVADTADRWSMVGCGLAVVTFPV